MLNVSTATKDIYRNSLAKKTLVISIPDANITINNSSIVAESLTITESIENAANINFVGCIAATMKFQCEDIVTDVRGKKITAVLKADGADDITVFNGIIDEQSNLTHEDITCEIVAYDALYKINNTDFADWYSNLTFPTTIKAFRDSFFVAAGVEQETTSLMFDNLAIEKTFEAQTVMGSAIIQSICQANCTYGRIGRNGKFQYVELKTIADGVYPSDTLYPADDLYPVDVSSLEGIRRSTYEKVKHDNYNVDLINKVQIKSEEDDIGVIYGTGNNAFVIDGNFLFFGLEEDVLQSAAQQIYNKVSYVTYMPAQVSCAGLPYIECGDVISLSTEKTLIKTYVLSRTLKGIQKLLDTFEAKGSKQRDTNLTSVNKEITKLRGKTNALTRTINETRSELVDYEKAANSAITQNANSIKAEVTRAEGAEAILSGSISVTADAITSEVTRATEAEGTLSSSIKQTADSIASEVTRATGAETTLSSSIKQTADAITSEVTRATNAESGLQATMTSMSTQIKQTADDITLEAQRAIGVETSMSASIKLNADSITSEVTRATGAESVLSTSIKQTADDITLEAQRATGEEATLKASIKVNADAIVSKVSKGTISSEISQEAGKIEIKSNRLSITSDNFTLTDKGKITAKEAELSGKITAAEGTISGFTIKSTSLSSSQYGTIGSPTGVYVGTDGISVGTREACIKMTSSGEVRITSIGSIKFGDSTVKMEIDQDGIEFDNGNNQKTKIKSDKVTVGTNNEFTADNLRIGASTGANTTVSNGTLDVNSTSSGGLAFSYNTIKLKSSSQYLYIKDSSDHSIMIFDNSHLQIGPYSTGKRISVGNSNDTLQFFTQSTTTGSKKKTVAKATTSSAVMTQLNALIDALQAYNLIG